MYYSCHLERTPVGPLTLASNGGQLVGLWLEGQAHFGGTIAGELVERPDLPFFDTVRRWLERYFSGKAPSPHELPLHPMGTPFQKRVWTLLAAIPYGSVSTYGDLARTLARQEGRPSLSAQAVGRAVGRNPIAIVIPCHRVIGSQGSLTGYAGGLEAKTTLLRLEGFQDKDPFRHRETFDTWAGESPL